MPKYILLISIFLFSSCVAAYDGDFIKDSFAEISLPPQEFLKKYGGELIELNTSAEGKMSSYFSQSIKGNGFEINYTNSEPNIGVAFIQITSANFLLRNIKLIGMKESEIINILGKDFTRFDNGIEYKSTNLILDIGFKKGISNIVYLGYQL